MKEPDLVDDYDTEGVGWARFDSTRKYRYRLARAISEAARAGVMAHPKPERTEPVWLNEAQLKRVVFVLLNPSTADAFKGDRTVDKCTEYARLWGFDVIEVANIFAFRSPYPEDVKQLAPDDRGADLTNDEQIQAAIRRPGVKRVIAGWGNHGALDDRGAYVSNMLRAAQSVHGFELLALKILPGGVPIHPLARGKNFIPMSIEPVPFR